MPQCGEVLVAILNNALDFAIAREQHWYRIPISNAQKWMKDRWPPKWLAFYQTKAFGEEAYAINYFAQVVSISNVQRWQLFPDEPTNLKSREFYYQIFFKPVQRLLHPIISLRRRRIIFIPTTWNKFTTAEQINDLYSGSTLEDMAWLELKRLNVKAERQELVEIKKRFYFLDFAIYCATGKIDVETDGDEFHANPERAVEDNIRDNDIETVGWRVLRFNGHQIQEEMGNYCVPKIVENINRLGGLDEGQLISRKIDLDAPPGNYQLSLFDDIS